MIDYGLFMMIYKPSKLIYSSVHIDRFIRDHFSWIPLYTYISFNGPNQRNRQGFLSIPLNTHTHARAYTHTNIHTHTQTYTQTLSCILGISRSESFSESTAQSSDICFLDKLKKEILCTWYLNNLFLKEIDLKKKENSNR